MFQYLLIGLLDYMIKILGILLTYWYANTLIIFLKNIGQMSDSDIPHYPIWHHSTSKKRTNRLYISKERWVHKRILNHAQT